MKHLVNSTSSLSAQKSRAHARPTGLREEWCWNGMAPASCAKIPGFVILHTLFSIALVRRQNLLSLMYWSCKGLSSGVITSCMFDPAYFNAFHWLWGGRWWDDNPLHPLWCWGAVAICPFVVKWVRICPCHCHVKTGTETSIISAVEAEGGRGWLVAWTLSHPFIGLLLTSSDCYCESSGKTFQSPRCKF